MEAPGINLHKMKKWIINKKLTIAITIIGGITGWLYWKFIGCTTGTCTITSIWYRSTIYGAIMGWLIGDLINDKLRKQKSNNHGKL